METEIGGRPGIARNHQKLKEARKALLQSLQRGHSPPNLLILDFQPQNCERINSYVLRYFVTMLLLLLSRFSHVRLCATP